MDLYKRRPETVKAEQFLPNKQPWPQGVIEVKYAGVENKFDENTRYKIGDRFINHGDWIVYDSNNILIFDDTNFKESFRRV